MAYEVRADVPKQAIDGLTRSANNANQSVPEALKDAIHFASKRPNNLAASQPDGATRRITVKLNQRAAEELQRISSTAEISVTEALRRAIATYALINEVLERDAQLLLVESDGTAKKIKLL